MTQNGDKLTTIVNAEKTKVVLGFTNIASVVIATYIVATHLGDIRHDLSDFRKEIVQLREDRDVDRAQMKELGEKVVAAINRITAIEARTEPRRN